MAELELDNNRFPETGIPSAQAQDDIAGSAVTEADQTPDILNETIVAGGIRFVQDEYGPTLARNADGAEPSAVDHLKTAAQMLPLVKWRDETGDYDKDEMFDELTEGVPYNMWEEVMQHNNLAEAWRANTRLKDRMTRQQRMSQQGAHFNPMYIVDGDLPLMFVTGGGYTAVGSAVKASAAARRLGMGTRTQRAVGASAQGLAGGAEAGVLLSVGGQKWREDFGWTEAAQTVLGGAIAGSVLSSAGTPVLNRKKFTASLTKTLDELDAAVATQDARLTATFGDTPVASFTTPVEAAQRVADDLAADAADSGSVGARRLPGIATESPKTDLSADPAGNVSETTQGWSDMADNWRDDSGWQERKLLDATSDPVQRALQAVEDKLTQLEATGTNPDLTQRAQAFLDNAGAFGHTISANGFQNKLYSSESSLLNFAAGNFFESASGAGRGTTTSAVLNKLYSQQIATPMRAIHGLRGEWARKRGLTQMGTGYGVTSRGNIQFSREVRLELNAREKGRAGTADPLIRRAADEQSKISQLARKRMQGEEGQRAVDGSEGIAGNENWQQYTWSGRQLNQILSNGSLADTVKKSRVILIKALQEAYEATGIAAGKDAAIIAEAVVTRASKREHSVETSVHGLLNRDGQDFMNDSLRMNGVDEATRARIMKRLVGDKKTSAQEGFTKSRNEIDLDTVIPTIDGKDLRIVDLLTSDLSKDTHTYVRKVAGSAALARNGITNRAQREEFIAAAQAQQRALGESPMNANEWRAMFSHFDGGGIMGFAMHGDAAMAEQTSVTLRRAANLAYLGKLGLTQLGETGALVAQMGAANFYQHSIKGWYDKAAREGTESLLKDVGVITGDIGYDHLLDGQHFGLDDATAGATGSSYGEQFMQGLDDKIKSATYIQGYLSGFNVVRGQQQKIAAAGMVDTLFQRLNDVHKSADLDIPEKLLGRMWNDLGIDAHTAKRLIHLIEDGKIEFAPTGHVNKINSKDWDADLQEIIGASIHRNQAQVVQQSLAGEQDAWVNTTLLGLLTHLKTFPMAAVNKGARRHLRNHDKEAVAAVLWGLATATAAVVIRNAANGKDQDVEQIARSAVQYSNLTGWAVMGNDTIMTILGMDNLKVNPYAGKGDSAPPALAWLGNAIKLPTALADATDGSVDYESYSSLKTLPFANVAGFSHALNLLRE